MSERKCCCGCCPVRSATKAIAIFYIIAGVYGVGRGILNLTDMSDYSRNEGGGALAMAVFVNLILGFVQLFLSCRLFVGACEYDEKKCLHWLKYNTVLTLLAAMVCIFALIILMTEKNSDVGLQLTLVLTLVFAINFYILYVVREFVEEIRAGNQPSQGVSFRADPDGVDKV